MREVRDYRESLRGKYDIDWKLINERAKMLRHIKNKASAYFTHKVGHGEVRDNHKDNSKYK